MESSSKFIERKYHDGLEGELDEDGFFTTPNGSFWDPDYVYFNREGYDKHGGYYDDDYNYIPGKGWDEVNQCYIDEIDDYEDDFLDDEGDDYNYHNVEIDDVIDEEKYINFEKDIEIIQGKINKNEELIDVQNDESQFGFKKGTKSEEDKKNEDKVSQDKKK